MKLVAKIYILLSLLLINACDFGCVSSEQFGTITLKSFEMYSNPFGSFRLRDNVIAKCKPGCGSDDSSCTSYSYWTSMSESFNSSYTYQASTIGYVSFCSSATVDNTVITSGTLYANLTAKMLDLHAATSPATSYTNNQALARWNDDGVNDRSAVQEGLSGVPFFTCAGKSVVLLGNDGGTQHRMSLALNANNYPNLSTLATDAGVANKVYTEVDELTVPYGCMARLYLHDNFQGDYHDFYGGDHNTRTAEVFTNTCDQNVIVYYGNSYGTQASVGKLRSCYLQGDEGIANDTIDGYYVPAGCFVEEYLHDTCSNSLGVHQPGQDAMEPGTNIIQSYDQNQVTGLEITDSGTVYGWKDNIRSAQVFSDTSNALFTDTSNMEPIIQEDIFGDNPGIYFDGVNDFFDYAALKAALQTSHTIFIVTDNPSGTIFGAVSSTITLKERLYVGASDILKYDTISGTYNLTSSALPVTSLITLVRDGSDLTARVNGQETMVSTTVGALSTGLDIATIGQYWNTSYEPQDFFSGHMGAFVIYQGKLSGSDIDIIEKNLMISWGIRNCSLAKHLSRIRLRIGDYESEEEVFDASGNFVIPSSYDSASGNMMTRYSDPDVDGGSCLATAAAEVLYADNLNYIDLNFKITKDASFIGKIYDFFILPIESYIVGNDSTQGIQEAFFEDVIFSDNSLIPKLVTTALTFYVIMTAIGYLMGLTQFSHWEFIGRIIKSGIIITLISGGSWEFFSTFIIEFFRDGSLNLAGNISAVISSETGLISNKHEAGIANIFEDLDTVLAMFLSGDINAKILGLLFDPPFTGALMVMMFYMSFYFYVEIIAKVLILYVSIFIMMTFTFIVAPVFLIFILFKQTQTYFNKWLDLLTGYFLQYIFLAAVIGIFSWIIIGMFVDLMGYSVCWKPVFYCCDGLPFHFTVLEFFRPSTFDYRRFNLEVKASYTPDFWSVALFLFMVSFFKQFLGFAMDLAATIAGGISASGMANAIGETLGTNNMAKTAMSAGKMADQGMTMAGGAVASASRMAGAATGGAVGAAVGAMTGNKALGDRVSGAMKGGVSNPYTAAKGMVKRNTVGALNRAVGQMTSDEKGLVADIKEAAQEGRMSAAQTGGDKEEAMKSSVKAMLQKKGMSTKQVDKVLDSKQLNKDIKDSKLSTSDAKGLLTSTFNETYDAKIKGGATDAEAKAAGRASVDEAKKGIGKTLRTEDGVASQKKGVFGGAAALAGSVSRGDSMNAAKDKWKKGGLGTRAGMVVKGVSKVGPMGLAQGVSGAVSGVTGAIGNSASSAYNKVTGGGAAARHKKMARMAEHLDKEFDKRGKEAPTGMVSGAIASVSDGASNAYDRMSQSIESMTPDSMSSKDRMDTVRGERDKFEYEYDEVAGSYNDAALVSDSFEEEVVVPSNDPEESQALALGNGEGEEVLALDNGDEVQALENGGDEEGGVELLEEGDEEDGGLAIEDVDVEVEEEVLTIEDGPAEESSSSSAVADNAMATKMQTAYRGMKARKEMAVKKAGDYKAKRVEQGAAAPTVSAPPLQAPVSVKQTVVVTKEVTQTAPQLQEPVVVKQDVITTVIDEEVVTEYVDSDAPGQQADEAEHKAQKETAKEAAIKEQKNREEEAFRKHVARIRGNKK